jgi:hemerythrin-like domain-containing protein
MAVVTAVPTQESSSQPLQLLTECHRRIEYFLEVLRLVVIPTHETDVSPEQAWALTWALRYFREVAPRHTQDEEHSLFPRLRESAVPESMDALAAMDRLEADHLRMEALQRQMESAGRQWVRAGHATRLQRTQMYVWLDELQELYHRHIDVEDTQIMPLALKTLNVGQLRSIAQEMRIRPRPALH